MRNENGVSLVGALVGIGLISVIMYSMTSLIKDSVAGQKYIEFRQAKETIRLHMVGILSERAACAATFGTVGAVPGVNPTVGANQFTQIRTGNAAVQFQVGQSYERNQARITAMTFPTNLPVTPPHTYRQFNAGIPRGSAEFIVTVTNTAGTGGGPPDLFFPVKLIVDLNAANQIQSCIAVGNDADDIWRLSSISEVYYNGGNVGIGLNNPNYSLEVVGSIRSSGTISAATRINSPNILAGTNGIASGMVTAGTIQSTKFLYTSDGSLKKDISPAPGLSLIRRLRGVQFKWIKSGLESFGVIAQEVETVMPSAVVTVKESNLKYVDYAQIISPLIQAAKEISDQNSLMEKRIETLERQLNSR